MQRATEKLKLVVTLSDLYEAVIQGAVYRIRPVMLSTGTGSEIMRRIAAPMVGGAILTLIIFPAVYAVVKGMSIRRALKGEKA